MAKFEESNSATTVSVCSVQVGGWQCTECHLHRALCTVRQASNVVAAVEETKDKGEAAELQEFARKSKVHADILEYEKKAKEAKLRQLRARGELDEDLDDALARKELRRVRGEDIGSRSKVLCAPQCCGVAPVCACVLWCACAQLGTRLNHTLGVLVCIVLGFAAGWPGRRPCDDPV